MSSKIQKGVEEYINNLKPDKDPRTVIIDLFKLNFSELMIYTLDSDPNSVSLEYDAFVIGGRHLINEFLSITNIPDRARLSATEYEELLMTTIKEIGDTCSTENRDTMKLSKRSLVAEGAGGYKMKNGIYIK